jgi:multiple sugar transport system permease protein
MLRPGPAPLAGVRTAALPRRPTPATGRWDVRRRQARFALLLLAPTGAMIALFIAYPIVYSFLLTFSTFSVREVRWFAAGLDNYQRVLDDRAFGGALWYTLLYTAVYVPLSVGLGLLVGVLLQQVRHGGSLFRGLLFLPTVVPVTMGYLMFQWILDPADGALNYVLREGLGRPDLARSWLSDPGSVFGSIVAITLWGFGPWILLLAGLLAIPKDFYEAARVDGANPFQEFVYVTLPQLRTTLMVVTTVQVIRALKIFVPIYILTSGGPANLTQSLYYLVFVKMNQSRLADATTVGWVFTFIVLILSVLTAMAFRVEKDRS